VATGTFTISITIPVTNAVFPDSVGRGIAATVASTALQLMGSAAANSGNLIYPPGSSTVVGTWSYTAPT
jgi:hypothetical protein